MPIIGLSGKLRMPRIGKFHLGYMFQPKGDKAPYPKATDYFVYPKPDAPGGQLLPKLIELYGEHPKELPIIFHMEDDELIVSQYYRCYTRSRGLVCRGTGEVCTRMIDTATGFLPDKTTTDTELREMECSGPECPDYIAGQCREVMNLQFMLKDIPGIGIWQVDTSSINSIKNINSCIAMYREIYGRINFVPLILAIEPAQVTPKGGTKKTVHVLTLRNPDTLQEAAIKSRMAPMELVAGPPDVIQVAADIKQYWPETEQTRMLDPDESASRMTATEITKAEAEPDQEPETEAEPPVEAIEEIEGSNLEEELFGPDKAEEPMPAPRTEEPKGDSSLVPMYTQKNIKTFTELYAAAAQCWGMKPVEIWPEVNFKSAGEYNKAPKDNKPSLWEVFRKIKAVR